ncbi:MAG: GNAT family N-acetyltransferase [Lachnospiraceae bacterium]|nr:GNAT family N-acetyltransferase [Lachnospiraceae bacterium]MEE3378696.1 GNAT family N-acetyltransferase [Lachnospiraceae bacterium]
MDKRDTFYGINGISLREMRPEDFEAVHELWMSIHGFAIRSVDDSYEGVLRFLKRNPGCSVVAEKAGEVVGSILCGHDGRTACFYHVCVREDCRKHGIGKEMVTFCMRALQREQVSKISLVAFMNNEVGNQFWNAEGWTRRQDLNQYEFILNEDNITRFNA